MNKAAKTAVTEKQLLLITYDEWCEEEIKRLDRQILAQRERRNELCRFWYNLLHKGEVNERPNE